MNNPEVSINVRIRYSTIYPLVYISTLASLYILPKKHMTYILITILSYKTT